MRRGRESIPGRLRSSSAEPDTGLEPANRKTVFRGHTKSRRPNRLSPPQEPRNYALSKGDRTAREFYFIKVPFKKPSTLENEHIRARPPLRSPA